MRELRQHVGGQVQETKGRPVCLLRTSMFPRKPIRSALLGEANFLASKTLAMTSLLVRVMSLFPLSFRCSCMYIIGVCAAGLAGERHMRLLWCGGCGGLHDMGTCAPEGETMDQSCSPAEFSLHGGTSELPSSRSA